VCVLLEGDWASSYCPCRPRIYSSESRGKAEGKQRESKGKAGQTGNDPNGSASLWHYSYALPLRVISVCPAFFKGHFRLSCFLLLSSSCFLPHTTRRAFRLSRQTPEVEAGCGKAARPVLCGGRIAICVPTAIPIRPAWKRSSSAGGWEGNWTPSPGSHSL
jgi:hypothetical protein